MPYNAVTSKLKRGRNQRRAILKLLADNLIKHKKIQTTEIKAKSVRPFVERLITVAKRDTIASRRYAARYLSDASVRHLHELASGYKDRRGGYTRIVKTNPRRRDNTRMAFIEFV
jgi:large subunit ribosomal protein L17